MSELTRAQSMTINMFAKAFTEYKQGVEDLKSLKSQVDSLRKEVISIALAKGKPLPKTDKQLAHFQIDTTRSSIDLTQYNVAAHWVKESERTVVKPTILK
mgnify:CR=1 FL=1|jgi:hypothetical protein